MFMEEFVICDAVMRPEGFNPLYDIQEVSQDGYVDLHTAFENGSLPSDVEFSDSSYDKNNEPASILGRPKDIFDAANMRQSVTDYKPPQSDEPAQS